MLVMGVYAPSVGYGFVYEDANDFQTSFRAWPGVSSFLQDARHLPFRSLTALSRYADVEAFGLDPWGFHLSNVAWHAVNVVGLLAIAWRVIGPLGAVMAAAIFAVHPIQVEAVAYVSSRAELVSVAGVLLALWAASVGSVAGAVVGLVCAVLGKETALVAWGLVPLWAWWTRAAFPVKGWLVAGAPVALIGVWAAVRLSGLPALDLAHLGETSASVVRLVGLVIVPWGFAIDHDWAAVPAIWQAASALGIGIVSCVAFVTPRHWLSFAWLWALVALAPRFVMVGVEGLHEHHFYLVMVGGCLGAGYFLAHNAPRRLSWV